jgi:hypothetical protein
MAFARAGFRVRALQHVQLRFEVSMTAWTFRGCFVVLIVLEFDLVGATRL